jgi:hypothetical protein
MEESIADHRQSHNIEEIAWPARTADMRGRKLKVDYFGADGDEGAPSEAIR